MMMVNVKHGDFGERWCCSVNDTGIIEKKEPPVLPAGVEPRTFLFIILDTLPLRQRRLLGGQDA